MKPHHPSPQQASHRAGFFTSKNMHRRTHTSFKYTKFNIGDYVPLLTRSQAETTNHLTRLMFEALGITGIKSYFKKLRIFIGISVVVGADKSNCITEQLKGFSLENSANGM